MNDERTFLALAGLLHDIGKFRQRALWGQSPPQRHELHGAAWVAEHIAPRLAFLEAHEQERLVAAIRDHHGRPYDRDARALIVADRLASGERVSREDEERGHPAREPLRAVLPAVRLEAGRGPAAEEQAHATVPLPVAPETWEAIFPTPLARATVDYPTLWERFERACAGVHTLVWQEPDHALHALLALLRAHAWCVPAATFRDEPDVSLYDHLRVTAALAVCVGEQETKTVAAWEAMTRQGRFPDEPVALLVGGDLSGIQQFLYAVSAAGAAKGLRGRSAYLALLSDAVVDFLLRELALPPTQVLYSSGGHFYLLVPPSAGPRIPELAHEITRHLVEAHGGNLALLLDAVPITGRDLRVAEQRLAERWAELTRRLGERKLRRFDAVLASHYEQIVGPFGGGGERRHCAVCHAEARPAQPVQEDRGVLKCSLCRSFEELGDTLARRPAFMALAPAGAPASRELTWQSVLARLGVGVQFWTEGSPPQPQRGALVFRLNRADLDGTHAPVAGFRWLPAFTPLERDGSIVELDTMAATSRGAHFWACARADVDNLGLVFGTGLGARYSLSRVATLSHQVSLFFEGYINRLCAHVDPEGRHLYLIYSGGDDLLLVGSWDRVVAALRRLREAFRRFTGHNPALTLCGGVTLHRRKYPLYQAASDAGRALEEAKGFRHQDGHTKDACTLFGVTMSWEEAEWVAAWQQTLADAIETARLPRRFLHRLARLAALPEEEAAILRSGRYTRADLARLVAYHRARYHLVYTLARAPEAVRPALERLRQELVEPPAGRFPLVRALTRWAELATRREQER